MNGISEEDALKVFSTIEYFSGYSFNKAHSAAYAVITYQTAKLKAHHFPEFCCCHESSGMGNHGKIRRYASACRRQVSHSGSARPRAIEHSIPTPKTKQSALDWEPSRVSDPLFCQGLMSNRPYRAFQT